MTSFNKQIYKAILKRSKRVRDNVSPEMLSVLTMTFMVLIFLHIGVLRLMVNFDWTYIDSLYFWMVTFTTVGFGDQLLPQDEQNRLIIHRLVGLALIAGIIDSIVAWIKSRKSKLPQLKKLLSKMKNNESNTDKDVTEFANVLESMKMQGYSNELYRQEERSEKSEEKIVNKI